ncbi:MAG: HupE/UreJ family protein [Tumebacillaceae bacterium]
MFGLKIALQRAFCIAVALLLMFLLPFAQRADAHAYSASYSTLTLTKTTTEMTFALDELSVIELVGGDVNKNSMLEQAEFDAVKDKLQALIKQKLTLKVNDEPTDWVKVDSLILDRKGDATKVIFKATYPPVTGAMPISFTDSLYVNTATTATYVDLLTIQYGEQKSSSALSDKNRTWALMLTDPDFSGLPDVYQPAPATGDQKQTSTTTPTNETTNTSDNAAGSGWFSFFVLGMNHILTGYDHLLFLFTLLIARQTFKQYATMITAFTIAHSLTLTLTVLGLIDVSPKIVEPMIAFSICFVAIDNIVRKQVSHRWALTFLFGLIHGMGFADILKDMEIPRNQLGVDLISFNLGIETVQVTIVVLLLPLLMLLFRWKYARKFVVTGSALGLVLGGIWLVQRLFFS